MKKAFLSLMLPAATVGLSLAGTTPAHALLTCTGNTTLGTLEGGFGADCGTLRIGETVEIDITPYFQPGGFAFENPDRRIAPGVGTNGTSNVAFRDVEVSFNAESVDGIAFSGPAAVWGLKPNGVFASAAAPGFVYEATNESSLPPGTFRTVRFLFGGDPQPGIGVFVGEALSFNEISDALGVNMLTTTNASISATLVGGVNPDNPTIVGFGLEARNGIPAEGTTIGGNVTTEVPGPLPIAGAGAAFAWSRKLRRKQRAAAIGSPGKDA